MKRYRSTEEILLERNFNPVEKLLDLYDELENDQSDLQQKLEENPDWQGVITPIENQKLRERVLSGITKVKQIEDGHRIKLLEIEQKNPQDPTEGKQGIILQHVKKTLPDGRVVIEKAISEQEEST